MRIRRDVARFDYLIMTTNYGWSRMKNTPKKSSSLEEVLASTSDVLFPEGLGERPVAIDSADCDGDTPLHVMVWRKDRYAVRLLIEAGADVNAIGDMGETQLHVAVAQENIEIIELLLKAGADFNIRSEFNKTPLESAREKGGAVENCFRNNIE